MKIGQQNAVDENGQWITLSLKTFMYQNHLHHTPSICRIFFKLKMDKCLSVSVIHVRAAQRWVKQHEEDPDSIFDSKKQGRRRILDEEHKMTVIKYVDPNPSADITEHLMYEFRLNDLKVSCSTGAYFYEGRMQLVIERKAEFHSVEINSPDKMGVREWDETDMNFLTNCLFLDESPFHINMKRTRAWSTVGTPAIVTVPTTRAKKKTTTVLGAISASGSIKVVS
ncbi:hypothetical protein A0J61_11525, partial [Choanephora cucurbitarum]